jgi:predicted nucleic acid-binding protein
LGPVRRSSVGSGHRDVSGYLADTSAWHRSGRVSDWWSELLEADAIALCTPVRLELLYSARNATDHRTLDVHLRRFRHLAIDPRVEEAAVRGQAALASEGQHRGPKPADLLIAAVAEVHDVTLLHYDRHFDLIAWATGQRTEWVARRGTLD